MILTDSNSEGELMATTGNSSKRKVWQEWLDQQSNIKKGEVEFLNADLTSDDAKELLEGNTDNRAMRKYMIAKYARLMRTGKWVLNGECLKIGLAPKDQGGFILLDGQHRLHALAGIDGTIRMSMAFGLQKSHFKTIDTGFARNPSDILKMAGYKNVHVLSAATRWMLTYKENESFVSLTGVCPEDILDAVNRWPKMAYFTAPSQRCNFLIANSISCFFMYVTQHIDPDLSYEFFYQLETSKDLEKKPLPRTSGTRQLHELLLKYKGQQVQLDKRYAMAYLIGAWNSFYYQEPVKSIKWAHGQVFPDIAGVNRTSLFKANSLKNESLD